MLRGVVSLRDLAIPPSENGTGPPVIGVIIPSEMSCQWKVLQHPLPAAGCADLYQALRELRTAAAMLVIGAHAERDRGLGVTMLHEISRAERAAARIVAARHAVPPAMGGLM